MKRWKLELTFQCYQHDDIIKSEVVYRQCRHTRHTPSKDKDTSISTKNYDRQQNKNNQTVKNFQYIRFQNDKNNRL